MLRLLVCVLLLAACLVAFAGGADGDSLRHWGIGAQLQPGRTIIMDRYQSKWMDPAGNMSFGIELRHACLPADSNAYDADYGYPTLGIAAKYSLNHNVRMHRYPDESWPYLEEVDYDSRMGNTLDLYGFFARPFFRNRRWEADYQLNVGVGYSHSKYNTHDAIDNELIGSRWLIFFGAGLHVAYQVAPEWSVRAGLEYWHLSNGAMNRPNKGANVFGPSLTVSYAPFYQASIAGRNLDAPNVHSTRMPAYMYVDLTAGVGVRTLYEDWMHTQFGVGPDDPEYRTDHFDHYMAYTAQTSLMCRYARRWATGIEADLFYGDYSSHVARIDQAAGRDLPHSPWSVGLGIKHDAFFHNLKMSSSIGWYLYREMGFRAERSEKRYYERIGVQYAFPRLNNLAIGFSVKAHLAKADYTELVLSYPIRLFGL